MQPPHEKPAKPPRRAFPDSVPSRASSNGEIQRWPGNTFICPFGDESPLRKILQKIQDTIRCRERLAQKMHFMPEISWHMTIFEGVNEENRAPGFWPLGKEGQELEDCTKEFLERLDGVELREEGLAPPYQMQVEGIAMRPGSVWLKIEAESRVEERRLRRLRDVLAKSIGLRTPTHESYEWHVGFCYLIRHLDDEDEAELRRIVDELETTVKVKFELKSLHFCDFENLHVFRSLLVLG
ncbi:hypothetical protein AC579_1003 [Pseudocercospora musae]|uniref:DUF1868 domain-containing protein n=1 Tax=Pseudocercospora musae TaxID=113226 RepID=A0A139IBJ5_9PEZI|nr:hypothetical protein AC579_1003 [Pseudocercospora musae]